MYFFMTVTKCIPYYSDVVMVYIYVANAIQVLVLSVHCIKIMSTAS